MTDPGFGKLALKFRARALDDRYRLAVALERGDLEQVRHLAHGLAGIGGIFGHAQISRSAELVEQAAINRDPDLAALTAALLEALDALR